MKYTLANQVEAMAAQEYLSRLVNDKRTVEIKRVVKRRSLGQNAYLHLLLGAFGAEFGYTIDEVKDIYKQLNKSIYEYDKNGRIFMRSSAVLTTEEMTKSIDKFRAYSSEIGLDLPTATDQAWLQSLENTLEQNRSFL